MNDDGWPRAWDIETELLRYLNMYNRPVRSKELYGPIADRLKLAWKQRREKRVTRDESLWHNRLETARESLVRDGLIDPAAHGFWDITQAGREELAKRERAIEDLAEFLS